MAECAYTIRVPMNFRIAAVMLVALLYASARVLTQQTIQPYLWQAGMARSEVGEINVFRRSPAERRRQVDAFYSDVLALQPLPATAPGGGQMIRYPVGASEVKLFPTEMGPSNVAAAGDVVGMRLLTFFYADETALAKRFVERGYPAPRFQPATAHSGATRPPRRWGQILNPHIFHALAPPCRLSVASSRGQSVKNVRIQDLTPSLSSQFSSSGASPARALNAT